MAERWLGITVGGDKVTMVDVEVPDEDGTLTIHADVTVRLPKGARPAGYASVAQEISDYAREKDISRAVVKASAVSQQGRPTLAHFEAAELRGVVLSALASVCETDTVAKAKISRTFGDRKADEYIADEGFWNDNFDGHELRVGSREAAFCVLAKCRK